MGQSDKKFYWIKLRTDFFQEDSPIDFLMSQENGAQYVVLYQMLCLKTANMNGQLSTQIGEVIIPYDIKKIVRDTKYFDVDTVTVALELFKKIGLIYEQADGNLMISNYSRMIGSESASEEAIKKREYRIRQAEKELLANKTQSQDNFVDKQQDNLVDNEVDKMSDRVKSIESKSIESKSQDINTLNITSTKVDVCPSFQEEPTTKYVYQNIVDLWNTLSDIGIPKINRIPESSPRVPKLRKRLKEYGTESFEKIVEEIRLSPFLQGKVQSRGKEPFNLSFDWVISPTYYTRILEGKYRDKRLVNEQPAQIPNDTPVQTEMSDEEWVEMVSSDAWEE